MDTSLSPAVSWVAIFGIVVALGLIVFGFRRKGWVRWVVSFFGVGVLVTSAFFLLALNQWMADARFRVYRSFYHAIEPGMTKAEVFDEVVRLYPEGGERGRPVVMDDNTTPSSKIAECLI
ncbi:MAG: hypothetical protein ACSHYF_16990 [Verrucomicrobiaceae bacterium]